MKNISLILFLFSSIVGFSQNVEEKISRLLENYQEVYGFSGNVLVVNNDDVIVEKSLGFANRAWHIPNTSKTKFRIASITKTFTAGILVKLQEEGKLTLDSPISNYLPFYPVYQEGQVIPTIRQVLNHTSGLPHYYGLDQVNLDWDAYRSYPFTPDSLAHLISTIPLEFKPGTDTQYSSLGYLLLGAIIENHLNISFGKAIQDFICQPLGLVNTSFREHGELIDSVATGYEHVWQNYSGRNHIGYAEQPYRDPSILFSTGGIYSTAEDLYEFSKAVLTSEFHSSSMRSELFGGNNGFGLAWKAYDESVWGLDYSLKLYTHDGLDDGHAARVSIIDEGKMYIIIVSNSGRQVNTSYITRSIVEIMNGNDFKLLKPLAANSIGEKIVNEGLVEGRRLYNELYSAEVETKLSHYNFSESSFNIIGIRLMRDLKRYEEAIEVFKWNVEMYPESANVFDSLAEAYMKNGNNESAIINYKIALQKLNEQEGLDNEWIDYVEKQIKALSN